MVSPTMPASLLSKVILGVMDGRKGGQDRAIPGAVCSGVLVSVNRRVNQGMLRIPIDAKGFAGDLHRMIEYVSMSLAAPAAMDMTKTPAASAGRGFFVSSRNRPPAYAPVLGRLHSQRGRRVPTSLNADAATKAPRPMRRASPINQRGARDVPAKPSCSWRPA